MSRRHRLLLSALLAAGFALWFLATRSPGPAPLDGLRSVVESRTPLPAADTTSELSLPDAAPSELEREPSIAPESAGTEARASIALRVLDDDGAPIAGARVETFKDSKRAVRMTDADGRALLPVAPAGKAMRLLVSADGFFHSKTFQPRVPELEVRLPRACALFGRVLEAESELPISGARIRHVHPACQRCDPDELESAADGSYRIDGVPVGRGLVFYVEAEDLRAESVSFEVRQAAPLVEHDFVLEGGVEVIGRVVDFSTALPIADACIYGSGSRGTIARTDESGSFHGRVFPSLPSERLALTVTAEGHCTMIVDLAPEDARADPPLCVRLPQACGFEGTVRDTEGRVIAGASIGFHEDHAAWSNRIQHAAPTGSSPLAELPTTWQVTAADSDARSSSDERGSFRVTGLVPWTEYRVRASCEGYRGSGLPHSDLPLAQSGAPGEIRRLDIVLEPLGAVATISGRMTLNGEPIAGTVIWRGSARGGSDEADPDGSFRLEQVEPGRVELAALLVDKGWRAWFRGPALALDVAPGSELCHDFTLEMPVAEISGTVRLHSGIPAAGVRVLARCRERGAEHETESGAQGEYILRLPDAGERFDVSAGRAPISCVREAISVGSTGIDLVLPETGMLGLRIVDASTRALSASPSLAWRRAASDGWCDVRLPQPDQQDEAGWYEIELPLGPCELLAREDSLGYRPALRKDVVVRPAGAGEPVELALARGIEIELRLREGSEPIPQEFAVLLLEEGSWSDVRRWIDADGRIHWEEGAEFPGDSVFQRKPHFWAERPATLQGLAPGRHRFKVFPEGIVIEPAELVLDDGANQSIEIAWRRAGD